MMLVLRRKSPNPETRARVSSTRAPGGPGEVCGVQGGDEGDGVDDGLFVAGGRDDDGLGVGRGLGRDRSVVVLLADGYRVLTVFRAVRRRVALNPGARKLCRRGRNGDSRGREEQAGCYRAPSDLPASVSSTTAELPTMPPTANSRHDAT